MPRIPLFSPEFTQAFEAIPQQHQVQFDTANQFRGTMAVVKKMGLNLAHDYFVSSKADQFARWNLDRILDTKVFDAIPQQPPVEGKTLYRELMVSQSLAIKFGLYDAADDIRYYLETMPNPETSKPAATPAP